MSIGSVNGAGRVSSPTADPPASTLAPSPPSAQQVGLIEIDDATNQPLPPRFPWLSRLAAQLEPVARQKSPFPPAPLLGDNLDQAV